MATFRPPIQTNEFDPKGETDVRFRGVSYPHVGSTVPRSSEGRAGSERTGLPAKGCKGIRYNMEQPEFLASNPTLRRVRELAVVGSKQSLDHLFAGVVALLTVTVLLAGWEGYAELRLRRFAPKLAALNLPEAGRGTVLQRHVLRLPHCLPVYGSSELSNYQPTRADLFFQRRRQGFSVALIGQKGDRCLILLRELAALGEAARGKKVVVFLSPTWFLPTAESVERDHLAHRQFADAYSPLQLGELVVGNLLKTTLKRRIAIRLHDFSDITAAHTPLLHEALASLREANWASRRWLDVLAPLLRLQNFVMDLQERSHWLELTFCRPALRSAAPLYEPRHKRLDWDQLNEDLGGRESKIRGGNFYSLAQAVDGVNAGGKSPAAPVTRPDDDADFLRRMQGCPEWNDLELLLAVSKAMGIHLLLINQPINGLFSDRQGITPGARRAYYDRISQVAKAHGVPLRDFSRYEEDRFFFADLVHPSAQAWVAYDKTLDDFYRQRSFGPDLLRP